MNTRLHCGISVLLRVAAPRLALLGLLTSPIAFAADFPLTGTIDVNGHVSNLPAGGAFVGSSYDPVSGAIGAGALVFPQATVDIEVNGLPATATCQISQTNTSSGQVWSDGTAGLTMATMKLEVLSITVAPLPPLSVAPCVLEPIDVELAGIASSTGLALADDSFTVPPVAPTDCAGFGDEINAELAGSTNSLQVELAGDFTPPVDDMIFSNDFELP